MKRFDVVPQASQWGVKSGGATVSSHTTKTEAVAAGRTAAKAAQPSSLRIHGKNGRIEEERTYPRSADPRRSKG